MNNQEINGAFPQNNFNPLSVNTTASVFNYNNVLSGVQNYMNLNYMANLMTGIDAKWFRAIPEQHSKDVIFQEYTLSDVDAEPICLKVVIPGGQFPDSKYNYDLMGLEYDVPLEIQIDVRYWKEKAGFMTMPQRGDVVYFPLNNKLYEVNSTYEFRGFAEQVTAYKCALVKYQNKASRKMEDDLAATIADLTVSTESLFGEEINNDIEKLVDKKENSPYINSIIEISKKIDSTLKIQLEKIIINSTLVNETCYDLRTSKNINAIMYKTNFDVLTDSNLSYSCWFYPIKQREKYVFVDNMSLSKDILKIKLKGDKGFNIGDNLNIYRDGAVSLTCKVFNIENGFYYCKIQKNMLNYLREIKEDWYNLPNLKASVQNNYNLIKSELFEINILNNKFIQTVFGDNVCISIIEDYLSDKWYGLCVNISNESLKISHNLWNENSAWEFNNDIQPVCCITEGVFDIKETVGNINEMFINKSYCKITNMRLYNDLLLNTKQQCHDLCSRKSKDADKAILLDDATIINTLDYINMPR